MTRPPVKKAESSAENFVAGAVAGAAASLVTHPLDTVVVRVCEGSPPSSDTKGSAGQVQSDLDLCAVEDEPRGIFGFYNMLVNIGQAEGISSLYSGATTRALYIAALSSIQFFLYEGLKQLFHVARPDLQLFLDILSGLELTPS